MPFSLTVHTTNTIGDTCSFGFLLRFLIMQPGTWPPDATLVANKTTVGEKPFIWKQHLEFSRELFMSAGEEAAVSGTLG